MQMIPDFAPIPETLSEALRAFRKILEARQNLQELDHKTFTQGFGALFFIAPGLHPDESGHEEGGWPVGWRCIGKEAFRRAAAGQLSDEELYPYPAAMSALGILKIEEFERAC